MTIIDDGDDVVVRNSATRELRSQLVEIERPGERVVAIPGRNNNIFASIAESMWVLAVATTSHSSGQLAPRCTVLGRRKSPGGRIRPAAAELDGTDQLREIIELLTADPESRRAVAVLYDPSRDMVDSLDVPCNNWLHFLRRDGQIHLHVVARSTDIWWGFSGINIFEWALLLEMMA